MVKSVNETFTDEEFKEIKKLKGSLSWRDYIMGKKLKENDLEEIE